MTEEMLEKAREAQSAEELLQLAKDNGMDEFTMEEAEDLYAQMHASGEMSDEEMENVSGGCSTKVDGTKYKVVSSGTDCFTGKWESIVDSYTHNYKRTDKEALRAMWEGCANSYECGSCVHLGFKSGTGYCEVEFG